MTTQDKSKQADFRRKLLAVAVAFIIMGIIFYFFVSAIIGVTIALLGAVFALGDQVYRNLPKK